MLIWSWTVIRNSSLNSALVFTLHKVDIFSIFSDVCKPRFRHWRGSPGNGVGAHHWRRAQVPHVVIAESSWEWALISEPEINPPPPPSSDLANNHAPIPTRHPFLWFHPSSPLFVPLFDSSRGLGQHRRLWCSGRSVQVSLSPSLRI